MPYFCSFFVHFSPILIGIVVIAIAIAIVIVIIIGTAVNAEKLFDMPFQDYADFLRARKEFDGIQLVS